MEVSESIPGEWVVLRAGACELALHGVGQAFRGGEAGAWQVESNAKLVLTVDRRRCHLAIHTLCEGR